jgi:hypothetical protein
VTDPGDRAGEPVDPGVAGARIFWWESWQRGDAGKWWSTWGAVALAVATGLGYLVGYGSTVEFARVLGVSVGDLGFDVRDYLVLAAFQFMFWVVAAATFWAFLQVAPASNLAADLPRLAWRLIRWRAHKEDWVKVGKSSVLFVAAIPVYWAALFLSIRLGRASGLTFLETWMVVGALAVVVTGVSLLWRWGILLALVLVVAVSSFGQIRGAALWANQVKRFAKEQARPTNASPLFLVLDPQVGMLTAKRESSCVVRVSDHVFVGQQSVVVLTEVDQFVVTKCKVAAHPFSP